MFELQVRFTFNDGLMEKNGIEKDDALSWFFLSVNPYTEKAL